MARVFQSLMGGVDTSDATASAVDVAASKLFYGADGVLTEGVYSSALAKIEVTRMPDSTTYGVGQVFSPSGMVVMASYLDGSKHQVFGYDYPRVPLTGPGVLISYAERGVTASCTLQVTIVQPSAVLDQNTPEMIAYIASKGLAKSYWSVGDAMTISIDGTAYKLRIAGFDHDTLGVIDEMYGTDYNNGTNKAAITFELAESTDVYSKMNLTATSSTGWAGSTMRTVKLPSYFGMLSEGWRQAVRTVEKRTAASSASAELELSWDRLFLLSEVEVLGTNSLSYAGEGTRYAIYVNGQSPIKKMDGANDSWLLRSPRSSGTTQYLIIRANGTVSQNDANMSLGVSFAFCV